MSELLNSLISLGVITFVFALIFRYVADVRIPVSSIMNILSQYSNASADSPQPNIEERVQQSFEADHYIRRFHVAMHNAGCVSRSQSFEHPACDFNGTFGSGGRPRRVSTATNTRPIPPAHWQ